MVRLEVKAVSLLMLILLFISMSTLTSEFQLAKSEHKPQYYLDPYVAFVNSTTEMIRFETVENVNFTIEYGRSAAYGQSLSVSAFDTMHEVNITGLEPDTLYYYKVTINNSNGEYNDSFSSTFKTATEKILDFTFIVIGDSRADSGDGVDTNQFPTLINHAVNNHNPRFIVMTGDVVTTSGNDYDTIRSAWKTYTDQVANISDHIPIFNTLGNHEHITSSTTNALRRYREIWMHPHNGDGEGEHHDEVTFWFEFGKSLFVFVSTEEQSYTPRILGNQLEWLNATLRKTGYAFKFVFFHRPICGSTRSGTVSGSYPDDSHQLDKMFSENNVSVAFSGHNHYFCYNTTRTNQTYVITGGAGAPLYSCDNALGTCFREYHYLIVNVTSSKTNVSMIQINGSVRHNFSVSPETIISEADTTPPAIFILSPENKTYHENDVPLTFAVNEPTSEIGYSLDSQAKATIDGNTTLFDLSDDSHSIMIFAKDVAGNTGASETIHFRIDTQSAPFLSSPEWLIIIVIVLVTGSTALTLYGKYKRVQRKKESIGDIWKDIMNNP